MSVEGDTLGPGWDFHNEKSSKSFSSDVSFYMKLEPRAEPYKIRLVATPIQFRKHLWAFRSLKQFPVSPAMSVDDKELDVAWKEGGFAPVWRYATYVLDRDYGNKIRILEASSDVFNAFSNHANATKTNPASATSGWDWLLIVTEEIVGGKKKRKYIATLNTSKGITPLTSEEIELVKKFPRSTLEKYYPKATPEEIQELWNQLPASLKNNKNNKTTGAAGAAGASTSQSRPANVPVIGQQKVAANFDVTSQEEFSEPSFEDMGDENIADADDADDADDFMNFDDESARMF